MRSLTLVGADASQREWFACNGDAVHAASRAPLNKALVSSRQSPSMAKGPTIRPYKASDHVDVISLWNAVFPNEPPWNDPALMIRRKVRVQPDLFLVGVSED